MHIVTVVGARPQFVKAGVVSRAIRSRQGIQELIIHTGQHYDENMSRIFFDELQIPRPDFNLEVGSGQHGEQTGKILAGVESILLSHSPDWLMVYGDTNSTLAGALAAAKLHIPVAHVEAGLRSFNRRMPEEINRVLTDHVSDLLFAPTDTAVKNLNTEGLSDRKILPVGDVMYDAAKYYGERATGGILQRLKLQPKNYILATIHRAENTDDLNRLHSIVSGLKTGAGGLPIIFPVHPRTRGVMTREGMLDELQGGITCIDPVGYLDMVSLERDARLIATDSGGVQKEAFFYRVPCVTLRDQTEWVELIDLGWNRVAPPISAEAVTGAIASALEAPRGKDAQPYGDAHAADKIADALLA